MPTIGQLDFTVAGSGLALDFGNFDFRNFLPLVFVREEAALDIAFRFAAMRPFYVSLGLHYYTSCDCEWRNALSSTRCLIACGGNGLSSTRTGASDCRPNRSGYG